MLALPWRTQIVHATCAGSGRWELQVGIQLHRRDVQEQFTYSTVRDPGLALDSCRSCAQATWKILGVPISC